MPHIVRVFGRAFKLHTECMSVRGFLQSLRQPLDKSRFYFLRIEGLFNLLCTTVVHSFYFADFFSQDLFSALFWSGFSKQIRLEESHR